MRIENGTQTGVLMARWNFKSAWDLTVAYRALYQDYESGSGANKFAYEGTTQGPLLGLGYRFRCCTQRKSMKAWMSSTR